MQSTVRLGKKRKFAKFSITASIYFVFYLQEACDEIPCSNDDSDVGSRSATSVHSNSNISGNESASASNYFGGFSVNLDFKCERKFALLLLLFVLLLLQQTVGNMLCNRPVLLIFRSRSILEVVQH